MPIHCQLTFPIGSFLDMEMENNFQHFYLGKFSLVMGGLYLARRVLHAVFALNQHHI